MKLGGKGRRWIRRVEIEESGQADEVSPCKTAATTITTAPTLPCSDDLAPSINQVVDEAFKWCRYKSSWS